MLYWLFEWWLNIYTLVFMIRLWICFCVSDVSGLLDCTSPVSGNNNRYQHTVTTSNAWVLVASLKWSPTTLKPAWAALFSPKNIYQHYPNTVFTQLDEMCEWWEKLFWTKEFRQKCSNTSLMKFILKQSADCNNIDHHCGTSYFMLGLIKYWMD